MDRYSRSIVLSLFVVALLIVALLVAAVTITFPVGLNGQVTHVEGEVKLGAPGQTPAALGDAGSIPQTLRPGERLRVEPGGAATVMFFNDGIAILSGPAELLLRESSRRGTALEHTRIRDHDGVEYALTIAQHAGTVEYRFDRADPAFDRVTIRVQLPGEVYIPPAPCWRIEIDAAGQADARTIPCPSF